MFITIFQFSLEVIYVMFDVFYNMHIKTESEVYTNKHSLACSLRGAIVT